MNNYDMELIEEKLIESIKNDSIKRNKKLNKLIEILNSINKNRIISIDGSWGCGKTVFLKQLEILNAANLCEEVPEIKKNNLNKYREKYTVYYYNSWQNDNHESPLLSLLYNLINDFPSEKNQITNKALPVNISEWLKVLTQNFIDLDKLKTYEDVAKEVFTIEEKRQVLNKIIDDILPQDKKLIFIIDELDRCRPDYAVKMLETIKHFYSNDKIIFILGTNNEQLSYTITNYYGINFDGYGYLNKFYNLVIRLDDITPTEYLENIFSIENSGHYINMSMHAVCNYFNLQMRDINRIVSDFDMLNDYFYVSRRGLYDEDYILKFVFLPYCLALKIKGSELSDFLHGNGYGQFQDYIKQNNGVYRIALYEYKKTFNVDVPEEKDVNEYLQTKYNYYFIDNAQNYERDSLKHDFLDSLSLIGTSISVQNNQ